MARPAWEYRTLAPASTFGDYREDESEESFLARLNEAGAEGWEVVGPRVPGVGYLLKRPLV